MCSSFAAGPGTAIPFASEVRHCGQEQTNGLTFRTARCSTREKDTTSASLLEALKAYRDKRWQVETFPWVIGVEGIDTGFFSRNTGFSSKP
jgi:hypothetical protein